MLRATMARHPVPAIRFDATVYKIDAWTLLRLPEQASRQLPSRGQVAVHGTINGHAFRTVLEPDGSAGHWLKVDKGLQRAARVKPGETANLDLEPAKEWPEPQVPKDLGAALAAAPRAIQQLWQEITPTARWEWVRWVNETKNPQTRQKRIEVTISKMKSGKRRPCCFKANPKKRPPKQNTKHGRPGHSTSKISLPTATLFWMT